MTEPCTCNPIPAHSSHEARTGAVLVDVTDARGRWHAVQVGETVYRVALVQPSAEEIAREKALREAARPAEEEAARAAALGEGLGPRERLLAALALRASSAWSTLPATARQRVQAVIDGAADRVRDLLA